VARGKGRLVLLVGEPGIGKTALCDQLARFVSASGDYRLSAIVTRRAPSDRRTSLLLRCSRPTRARSSFTVKRHQPSRVVSRSLSRSLRERRLGEMPSEQLCLNCSFESSELEEVWLL
jgi:hypothetical protein